MADQAAIDAVLDADFLGELGDRPMVELRVLRQRCDEVETDLSYRRRVLHGHLDLLRAELARRDLGPDAGPVTDLLTSLGEEHVQGNRSPSHQRLIGDLDLADLDRESAPISADLPDCTNEELQARGEALVAREHALSEQRRAVLGRLDLVQAEVVRRYREGAASIDEILPGSA